MMPAVRLQDVLNRLAKEISKQIGAGRTQAEIAAAAGVEQPTVSRILNSSDLDARDLPGIQQTRFETVRRIVEDGLGLTFSSFLLQIERGTDADSTSSSQPSTTPVGSGSV